MADPTRRRDANTTSSITRASAESSATSTTGPTPPAFLPDPSGGDAPVRSEALPPGVPTASDASVTMGPPGSVTERTEARPAAGPVHETAHAAAHGAAHGAAHEAAHEAAMKEAAGRDGSMALRLRVELLERENRELWSLLHEERRTRVQEMERLTRLVELACRTARGS
ncbi:MAG TPA: hypothetical protein VK943_20165 [Arenibaculum sp.]|nr:hypothetical protein [Arenibaculum sp.]